jgi:hypothetical protein
MKADSIPFEHAFLPRVAIVNGVRQSSYSDPIFPIRVLFQLKCLLCTLMFEEDAYD